MPTARKSTAKCDGPTLRPPPNWHMKDYFDLYNILSKEKYDVDTLQEAIMHTFENRHTSYDADTMFFRKDFANNQQMQVRWQAFLRKILKSEYVTFADVVVYIQNKLRPYWEKLSNESK